MNLRDKIQKKKKKEKKKIGPKVVQNNCINTIILIPEWFKGSEKKLGNQNIQFPDSKSSCNNKFFESTATGNLEEDFEPRGRLIKHQEIPLTSSFNSCKAC